MRQQFHDASGPGDAWLSPRLQMTFRPAASPIRDPLAKLGGQPVWSDGCHWPLSAAYGTPMMFVGQFPVPGVEKRMAYLFVTDNDGTVSSFKAEGGENALLVQPGGRIPEFLTVTDAETGPSLWRRGASWDEHVPVELLIATSLLDPAEEWVLEEEIAQWEAERRGEFIDLPDTEVFSPRSYIGGRPNFWQPRIEVPSPWRFFFQIHGMEGWDGEPYALNFGGGTGYAFVSPDACEGRFYWDCV
ncbi:hypothetical protein [Spirillospora sp. NPDC048824]|uniref:hypothetical protein n=1 Tax=Spirillospora sp. NPDC048824 TaxID=3364526 RepID=UPI0037152652